MAESPFMWTLDPDLATDWPSTYTVELSSHQETVTQRFLTCKLQSRELPYYGVWLGSPGLLSHVCALYSSGRLNFEVSPQDELIFRAEADTDTPYDPLTQFDDDDEEEEEEEEEDGDDFNTAVRGSVALPFQFAQTQHRELKRMAEYELGDYWKKPEGKRQPVPPVRYGAEPKRAAATAPIQALPAPDSGVSNTSTSSGRKPVTIYRIVDGIVKVREKRASARDRQLPDDADVVQKATPAILVELKSPNWSLPVDDEEEPVEGTAAERARRQRQRNKERTEWDITEKAAEKAIFDAQPQIVQQAQFAFHGSPDLNTVWCIGASGRWARFTQYVRGYTPEIEVDRILGGQYYKGSISHFEIAQKETPMIEAINDEGEYTEDFKEAWRQMMVDVEELLGTSPCYTRLK